MQNLKQKSLKFNTILNVSKTFLSLCFPLITFPYSSRILGPENLGKVNFANSIVAYFAILASLGISTYATREASKVRNDITKLSSLAREILIINLISTFISYILLAIALVFVKKLNDYRMLIIICSSLIIFTTLGMDWLYQALEEFSYITIRSLIFQIFSILLLFAIVKTKDDYLKYASVNIIANVGANICNFFHCRKFLILKNLSPIRIKIHLKPIFFLFASAIVSTIFTNIDNSMLGFLSNNESVGLYAAGIKLIRLLGNLFPAFFMVLYPRISYYRENTDNKKIQDIAFQAMNILTGFSFPIMAGLFVLMKPFIFILCGNQYINAIPIALIMIPIIFINSFSYFLGCILIAFNKENITFRLTIISALIDVFLNFILISHYAAYGAALTTVIAEMFLAIAYMIYVSKNFKIKLFFRNHFNYLTASFVMGIIVYFTKTLFTTISDLVNLFLCILCGAITYALLLFILRDNYFLYLLNSLKKRFLK